MAHSRSFGMVEKTATILPLLATLTHMYLAIPATSAPSERIWSRTSRVLSLKRESLKAEGAQKYCSKNEKLSILQKHNHGNEREM